MADTVATRRGGGAAATLWRLVGALVYTLSMGLASVWLARRLLGGDGDGGESTHRASVRALATRPERGSVTLDDVGGLAHAKHELRRAVLLPLQRPELFFSVRELRPPRGVLLHGPPGTGKTLLARALACESGASLLALHAAALESKWFGEAPKLLQAAFALARTELAPCLVFFDEVDALGRARSEHDQSCTYTFKCELLRNLDTLDGTAPVVVLACTNCPQSLDPALRRRFPCVVHVDRPDEAARRDILRVLVGAEDADATLAAVARATAGMTGADLAAMHAEASAARMSGPTFESAVAHSVDGPDLLARLPPLAWSHWVAAAAARGATLDQKNSSHVGQRCVTSSTAATTSTT